MDIKTTVDLGAAAGPRRDHPDAVRDANLRFLAVSEFNRGSAAPAPVPGPAEPGPLHALAELAGLADRLAPPQPGWTKVVPVVNGLLKVNRIPVFPR